MIKWVKLYKYLLRTFVQQPSDVQATTAFDR